MTLASIVRHGEARLPASVARRISAVSSFAVASNKKRHHVEPGTARTPATRVRRIHTPAHTRIEAARLLKPDEAVVFLADLYAAWSTFRAFFLPK